MYVEVSDVKKSYGEGGSFIQVLNGVSVGIEKGDMCVIQGTSGSGKSTLLNCIGGLDTVDSGSIQVDGKEMVGLKADELSDYRRDYLGFIFQFYNLVPNLTVRENIQVCEYLTDNPLNMDELLDILGLTEHQNKFPAQLSGGQQQRCADVMRNEGKSVKSEEYYYAYRLNDSMTDDELKDELKKLKLESDAGNLLSFVKAGDNVRIQAASGDQELYRSVGIIAGCIILVLISYVLSVFVVHSIDQESSVIGALYALGVNKKDLMRHYVMLPTIIAAVSGVIGTLIAYSDAGVRIQMQDCYNYYSLPDLKVMVMPYLIIYGIIAPPIICFIVTSLVINKRLSRTVLSLMKNEQKVSRGKDIRLKNMKFIRLFKIRQLLRERRTAFTVVFGMFVSLLIAVMAVEIFVYCNNVRIQYPEDTKYEYMYSYKYPSEVPPEGGYKAYAKTMKKSIYGYKFDVTVMGITDDNSFFDVDLEDSQEKVTISSSVMYKYGLKEGDVITLKDEENNRNYSFEISGVTQYSPSFVVFMPYEKALELFAEQDDYYNVVFADHDLNIEPGRLYSTTTKENVKEAAGIFVNQMKTMIVMLGIVAVLIFAIILYLMMKVMIDRSSYSIALIKIFGYRNRELKKMYLDGNFYVVAIGALISVPLAKLIMDAIYEPALAPNVACGVDKSFPIWIYIIIYAAIFILYFIINNLLVRRIKHMLPAEVLKNRE